MRTTPMLDALLPRVRQEVLSILLLTPQKWWYVRELASHLERTPSSLQRELEALTRAGILERSVEGRQVYFRADAVCPILPDLQGLLLKTAGLVDLLRKSLKPFASRVVVAFVFGSIARGEERSTSDVDLFVVGSVDLYDLAPALEKLEDRLQREVNVTVYELKELRRRLADGAHLPRAVLRGKKLFVFGDDSKLAEALGRRPSAGA